MGAVVSGAVVSRAVASGSADLRLTWLYRLLRAEYIWKCSGGCYTIVLRAGLRVPDVFDSLVVERAERVGSSRLVLASDGRRRFVVWLRPGMGAVYEASQPGGECGGCRPGRWVFFVDANVRRYREGEVELYTGEPEEGAAGLTLGEYARRVAEALYREHVLRGSVVVLGGEQAWAR